MGYTNYWRLSKKVKINDEMRDNYKRAIEVIKFNLENQNTMTDNFAIFLDGKCETFALPYNLDDIFEFDCCKTDRGTYDKDVLSSLMILKHYVPQIKISCDGINNDDTFEDIVLKL